MYISLAAVFLLASCTMPWSSQKTEEITNETIPLEADAESTASTGDTATITPSTETTTPAAPTLTVPTDTPKAVAEGGIYLPYTSTAVAQAKGEVVLFFHASWCPTCIAINKDIEAHLKDIPKDVTILKVNYDEATGLREAYSVTGQYTFVQVDNDGKLIKKWRGGATLNDILTQVEKRSGGSIETPTANPTPDTPNTPAF